MLINSSGGFVEEAVLLKSVFGKQFSILSQRKDFPQQRKLSGDAHKYDRGHVLVFAGSPGKFGAASLCVQGAHVGGAGWVTFAVTQRMLESFFTLPQTSASTVYEPLLKQDSEIDAKKLVLFLEDRSVRVIVFGPGWMENHLTREVCQVIEKFSAAGGSLIFDAGATKNLIGLFSGNSLASNRTLALPHPGEWKKLGSSSFEQFQPNSKSKVTDMKNALSELPFTIVWKSSRPIVFSAAKTYLQNLPCADLSRAGTGDFLAGLVAGSCLLFETMGDAFLHAHAALVESARSLRKANEPAITLEKIISNVKSFN